MRARSHGICAGSGRPSSRSQARRLGLVAPRRVYTSEFARAQEGAAEAAEAAGEQGKFWEMHDTLYENQSALAPEELVGYAKHLHLDVADFTAELTAHAHAKRIRKDFLSGVRSGVNGTPTFFINGVRHDGANDVDTLLAAIRARLRGDAASA
jgi:protein-disulfide isomerase